MSADLLESSFHELGPVFDRACHITTMDKVKWGRVDPFVFNIINFKEYIRRDPCAYLALNTDHSVNHQPFGLGRAQIVAHNLSRLNHQLTSVLAASIPANQGRDPL